MGTVFGYQKTAEIIYDTQRSPGKSRNAQLESWKSHQSTEEDVLDV
jgi:hypothetical protein